MSEHRFNRYAEGRNFPEFTKEDIDVFYDGFTSYDTDGDNRLDKKELATALKFLGQSTPADKFDAFFKKVDSDGSGFIEWGEFLAIMRLFYSDRRRDFEREYYSVAKQFPEFTRNDIDGFIAAFHEFDADGSGALDVHELGECFKAMGMRFNKDQVQQILNTIDADNSGVIEWNEFLEIMRVFYASIKEEFEQAFYTPAQAFKEFTKEDIDAFIEAFRQFDVDGSGTLDTKELTEVFRYLGQRCNKQQLQQILDIYDTDRSGTINWTEFLHIMRDFYAEKLPTQVQASTPAPAPAPAQTKAEPAKTQPAPVTKSPTPAPAPAPAKAASQPAPAPAPATKTQVTKTPSSSLSNSSGSASSSSGTKCARCGKTVYALESVCAVGQTFHKGCFKCQGEGCDILLTLKTFKGYGTNVYCVKHLPKTPLAKKA